MIGIRVEGADAVATRLLDVAPKVREAAGTTLDRWADALNDYPGALLLVSHDRHLLGLVCDDFWRVARGKVEHFDGDLDDYAHWLRQLRSSDNTNAPAVGSKDVSRVDARERRRAAAAERERTRGLRKHLNEIESSVARMDQRLDVLTAQLADPDIYVGPTAALAELAREQGELRERKERLEDEWLELSETLAREVA